MWSNLKNKWRLKNIKELWLTWSNSTKIYNLEYTYFKKEVVIATKIFGMGATTWRLDEDGKTIGYLESLDSIDPEVLKDLESPKGSDYPAIVILLKAGAVNGERIALSPQAFGETEDQWTIPPVPHDPFEEEF